MGLAAGAGGLVVTLMVIHLLASMIVAEMKNLRSAVYALVIQSLTLCFVILLLGWGQTWMVVWFFLGDRDEGVLPAMALLENHADASGTRGRADHGRLDIVRGRVGLGSGDLPAAAHLPRDPRPHDGRGGRADPFEPRDGLHDLRLGLYVCVARRDLVKVIIGVVLLENGAHLALISLVPARPETAILGIVTNVVLSAWLLLYFGQVTYKVLGTTDTLKLSELKR